MEDDTDQIFLYQSKFKIEGLDLIFSRTGQEGLELAKKENPALILLDLVLIAENGLDVLAKLKKDPNLKHIPVIILTNLVQEEVKNKAKELGAVDFLIKTDMMPSDVVKKVKEILKT
ncbi:MAG: response regulator [Patescibacteria group bacterium]